MGDSPRLTEKMGVGEVELYEFIFENIDTVPHLEALLLLWNLRPQTLTESEVADRLFVKPSGSLSIIGDLARRGLLSVTQGNPLQCGYLSSPEKDRMVEALASAYRTDLIRISTAIHSKASPGVREFARAFEFKRKGKKP
ncbi:MAG TPA: hypothetical protein VHW09_10960 [Bryobacteraceae bacterium]|jgi:hypothetical protein|nr:hypothetical protein [Bryobacteraceae bacterium]